MEYKYDTPENAVVSLETAYSKSDIENVINSKDFETEALLILEKTVGYDVTPELVSEVAQLLELSLIQSLKENGFPNFNEAKREFSEAIEFKHNIFTLEERLFYPDSTCHINKIFLTNKSGQWKVAMVEE